MTNETTQMTETASIECRLHRAAREYGNNTAVSHGNEHLSFRQLDELVSERAAELQQYAVGNQQWIALRITTSRQGIIDWLAVLRAGGLALPVTNRMPTASLHELLKEQGITLWLTEPGANPAPVPETTPAEAPKRAPVTEHANHPGTDSPAATQRDHTVPTGHNSRSNTHPAIPPQACLAFTPHTPCAGVLTSGSTGQPRIVVLSYANIVRNAQGSQQLIPLTSEDNYLLSLPLNHVGGLAIIMRCLETGAKMILGGRAEDALFLHEQRITHVSMVETQLRRLLEQSDDIKLPELRCLLLGGGPVADSLLQRAHAHGLPCYLSYGMSEMASQVLTHDPQGKAHILPYRELSLAADGEILVRGETLSLGYMHAGVLTPATEADGWLHTRDLGSWQGEALTIIGRKDNQFISGGENIQPESIERELRRHPLIREAVVVARPDANFGRRPVAFLDCNGEMPPPEELKEWLRQRLTAFMIPDDFLALPRQEGLKVQRSQLQRLAEQNQATMDSANGGP